MIELHAIKTCSLHNILAALGMDTNMTNSAGCTKTIRLRYRQDTIIACKIFDVGLRQGKAYYNFQCFQYQSQRNTCLGRATK